jgi:hypothetical protein
MISRRRVFCVVAFLSAFRCGNVNASLVDIENLGKALSDAADAIGKLGDSIAHLAALGAKGWDAVSARRTRDRLIDISARLSVLSRAQVVMLRNIDEYITQYCTDSGCVSSFEAQDSWEALVDGVTGITNDVSVLLVDLENERSGLVTEDVYQDLIGTLQDRKEALSVVRLSLAPSSAADLRALRYASRAYRILIANLQAAIKALNTYIQKT